MKSLLTIFGVLASLIFPSIFGLPLGQSSSQCEFGVSAAKESARSVGNLAVKLYEQIGEDGNVIFSPVSIALALAMVENGAAGKTKDEIQALIGSQGPDSSTDFYQSLQHQLQMKGEKARLSIANGFFHSEDIQLMKEYLNKMENCFETQLAKEPFSDQPEVARHQINQWVSNATANKIPELFKSGSIGSDTVAVLANAIYMKAPWMDKFSGAVDLPFYQSGKTDQAKTVHFMTRQDDYRYTSTENFESVELPYGELALSMYIILPKQRDGIRNVEKWLSGDNLISLIDNTATQEISLKIPKFTIRKSVDLKQILVKLGIQKMFTDSANFSRMTTKDVKVSSAVHEAYIKVNENGTEAAAATGFVFVGRAMMMPVHHDPIPFVADHPFMFAIVHKPTRAVVFMGKVNSVEDQD